MALEWLKSILGDTYTEELDKQICTEIGKAFVSKADFTEKANALKAAQEQLSNAGKTIDSFKAMDIDGIKKNSRRVEAKGRASRDNCSTARGTNSV